MNSDESIKTDTDNINPLSVMSIIYRHLRVRALALRGRWPHIKLPQRDKFFNRVSTLLQTDVVGNVLKFF